MKTDFQKSIFGSTHPKRPVYSSFSWISRPEKTHESLLNPGLPFTDELGQAATLAKKVTDSGRQLLVAVMFTLAWKYVGMRGLRRTLDNFEAVTDRCNLSALGEQEFGAAIQLLLGVATIGQRPPIPANA